MTSITEIPSARVAASAVLIPSSFLSAQLVLLHRELRMHLVARGSTNFVGVNNAEDADREHHYLPSERVPRVVGVVPFHPGLSGQTDGRTIRQSEGGREREVRGVAPTSEGREVGKSLFLISLHLTATESLLPGRCAFHRRHKTATADDIGRASSRGCHR